MAGQPEAAAFALLSALALVLVALVEVGSRPNPLLSLLAFVPLLASAWFLSLPLAAMVVALAIFLEGYLALVGVKDVVSAVAAIIGVVLLAPAARLLAVALVRWRESETRSNRMSELERAKSEFLRLASHELRTPVAVLRGYLSMLEDGSLGEMPARARDVLPVMSERLRTMSLMVDQMLDMARLEDSRLQLRAERFDLGSLVRETAAESRTLIGPNHHLIIEEPPAPVQVSADRSRVSNIVRNLVDNAFKYSPNGGVVRVATGSNNGQAWVVVRDQGVGIQKQAIGRLFTPFSRITTPDTAGIPGTGLGLYLCRQLARMHSGDVTVESEAGRGSSFTLTLPSVAPAQTAAAPESAPKASRRRRHEIA